MPCRFRFDRRSICRASVLLAVALGGCGGATDPGEAGVASFDDDATCSPREARIGKPVITLMAGPLAGSFPSAIAASPAAGVWFSDGQAMTINRLGEDGTLSAFRTPLPADSVFELTLGSDDNVWFENFGWD